MDTASAGATVEQNVLCAGCGYNLRGLAVDGSCPECAAEVARSLCGNPLIDADVEWLTRLVRGQTLIAWTLLGGFMLTCVAFLGWPILQHLGHAPAGIVLPIAICIIVLMMPLLTVGTVHLTSEVAQDQPLEGQTRRRLARGLMIALAVGSAGWWLLFGLGYVLDIVTYAFARTFTLIATGLIVVAILGAPATISLYVLELLGRVPRVRLPGYLVRVVDRYMLVGVSLIGLRVVHGFAAVRLLPHYVGNGARWMFLAGLLVLLFYGLRIVELMLVGMRTFRMCRRVAARRQRRLQAVPREA